MIARDDLPLRLSVYRFFADHGRAPVPDDLVELTGMTKTNVWEGLLRLHEGHALLLEDGRIRMANPFSGIETDFMVTSGERSWYANCIWDAFGILVCQGIDGDITTHCPESRQALNLSWENETLGGSHGIVHFDRPFARWYDNLVET